jgi:predicted nucleic acid-binding protein
MTVPREIVVVDASVLVEMLARTPLAVSSRARLRRTEPHAPAHLDIEVLSALGRLNRAGALPMAEVEQSITLLTTMPVQRHSLVDLVADAWAQRGQLRLTDACYVALAARLGVRLLTTDHRLARACPLAETIA